MNDLKDLDFNDLFNSAAYLKYKKSADRRITTDIDFNYLWKEWVKEVNQLGLKLALELNSASINLYRNDEKIFSVTPVNVYDFLKIGAFLTGYDAALDICGDV